jgi:hypothetical protein
MISRSPERMTFQKEGYIRRCKEEGKEPNPDYVKMHEDWLKQYDERFNDPKSRIDNMEYDLLTTDWILEKVRTRDDYAQNLYAAMCNMHWCKRELIPALRQSDEDLWGCSWRYAGGIIADMRQEGDYIDWYCSGIRDVGVYAPAKEDEEFTDEQKARMAVIEKYVAEGFVTDEIERDLNKLGWFSVPYKDE